MMLIDVGTRIYVGANSVQRDLSEMPQAWYAMKISDVWTGTAAKIAQWEDLMKTLGIR